MATRMQQRRGTASQWVSSNAGDGPILNAGEIGWESDTNKFKIGDGVTYWDDLVYFADVNDIVQAALGSYLVDGDVGAVSGVAGLDASKNLVVPGASIIIEGATADEYETTLTVVDPTADRTITFQNATGTVVLRDSTDTLTNKSISLGSNTVTSTLAQLNTAVTDADVASLAGTETLTNKTLTSPKINEDVVMSATATELNLIDGSVAGTVVNSKAVVYGSAGEVNATTLQIAGTSLTATATELNYVDGVTSAIQTQMDAKAPLAGPALTGDASAVNLTISGNLTVNGTTTNINSTNLVVEDKNIILGDTETPANNTADGGGITLKGTTDKTLNWVDATSAWTSSEDFNLLTGKVYEIAGTSVLSGTTLGSGVTGSSLTSVGTLSSGTWSATTIATTKGGTGLTGYTTGDLVYASATDTLAKLAAGTNGKLLTMVSGVPSWEDAPVSLPSQTGNSGKYLTTDGSTASWGTVSGFSAPTLGSTSIASGSTTTTIVGLVKINTTSTVYTDGSGFEVSRDLMQIMGAL